MKLADNIFGPNIGALKVKNTRINTKTIKYKALEITPELMEKHKYLTHFMGIIFVNEMPMINGIDRNIRYQSLVSMNSRSKD